VHVLDISRQHCAEYVGPEHLGLVAIESVDGSSQESHVMHYVSRPELVQFFEARLDHLVTQREAHERHRLCWERPTNRQRVCQQLARQFGVLFRILEHISKHFDQADASDGHVDRPKPNHFVSN